MFLKAGSTVLIDSWGEEEQSDGLNVADSQRRATTF